jgi:hypothetical protein
VRAACEVDPAVTRLHTGGTLRRWLGARFGRDEAYGDRVWRRILHASGAFVLIYYPFPDPFLGIVPKLGLLLAALGTLFALEFLRHAAALEIPALREYERGRPASFVFYGIALVAAVVFLPLPIGSAVVLGTSLVDPLIGELRASPRWRRSYPGLPYAAWFGLGVLGLAGFGGWPLPDAIGLAAIAGAAAIAVERPKIPWMDDDLLMTFVPAAILYGLGVVVLGLGR